MSSLMKFLVGGNGKTVTLFTFDAASKSINLVKTNSGFTTPSWIESSVSSSLRGKVFYAASEENGKVQSLELKDDGTVVETGSAPTGGNPAHGMCHFIIGVKELGRLNASTMFSQSTL